MAGARMTVLFVLFVSSLSIATSKSTGNLFDEPVCSKYHFEEEVLKKLIRLEFELEKEGDNHKKEIADMKIQMDSLKEVTEKDMRAVEENVETQLKGVVSQKSASEGVSVSFLARNPPTNLPLDIIVFSTTVHNSGGHYNVGTGRFTAPVTGTYLFSTQLCSDNHVKFQLVVNNAVLGVSYQFEKTDGVCSSMVTVGHLTAGQQAWVKCSNGSAKVMADDENQYWNMFVGVLITQTSR